MLHRTLLSWSVVMYPEAVGSVLIVELHVEVVVVLVKLRLRAVPLVHQLVQVALLQPVIVVAHLGSMSLVLEDHI